MTTGLVDAWRIDTGRHDRIPAHWLDHPMLGAGWTTTRPQHPVADCCGGADLDDDDDAGIDGDA